MTTCICRPLFPTTSFTVVSAAIVKANTDGTPYCFSTNQLLQVYTPHTDIVTSNYSTIESTCFVVHLTVVRISPTVLHS